MTRRRIFITGTAGFIGFHLARLLLDEGWAVAGFDGMTPYYDVRLKERRHQMLLQTPGFEATVAMLEEADALAGAIRDFAPDAIVHLAAQVGVRHSLENPRAYLEANLVGTFNVLEAAREAGVSHLLMASTSSVYGASRDMPFRETARAAEPLSFYAASKIANESMAHSHAHLWGVPTTMFRFFTVYGPWGRPDMALFRFTRGILEGAPIDLHNRGEIWRDFTYVADLVRAIRLLIDAAPPKPEARAESVEGDALSAVAPHRIVNIGNSEKVKLTDLVDAVEEATGRRAERRHLGMQPGDMLETWADTALLQRLTGYRPATSLRDGVRAFVAWYRDHHGV